MKPDASIPLRPSAELAQLKLRVDTREQRPWFFPEEYATVRRDTLEYGDYALEGDSWAIERKSLTDFVGTVCAEWDRFVRELARMPVEPQRVIIVEAGLADALEYIKETTSPDKCSDRMKYFMRRVAQLTMIGVSVLFCDSAELAAIVAWRLFRRRAAFLNGVDDLPYSES